jgi:NAD(P)-dependent dehydrogenase (short-subunit alcohol dehydrogenase family)
VAIASAMAAEDAFVIVSGRDKSRGDAVVADIRAAGGTAEFVGADLGAVRDAFAVNVFAPFLLTGLLAPAMAQRGEGAIVNIGSIAGLRGMAGSAVYNANKAVMHSFTHAWADEYGPSGVRVNAVAPGPIATERAQEFADHTAPLLARIPSRRLSTPAEAAAAVVFLASDDASNIHGVVLSVDGGWAAV